MRISDWSSDVCSSDLRAPSSEGRIRPIIAQRPVADAAPELVEGRHAPHVAFAQRRAREVGKADGEGLRRREAIARRGIGADGALLDFREQTPVAAVEQIDLALLCRLDESGDDFAAALDVDERRLRAARSEETTPEI